jgi:outer membrane protein OmpA-like peptidoglycan-associated protein
MNTPTPSTIVRTVTAAGAALLLACGGQQTHKVDAEMTPEPMARSSVPIESVQPVKQVHTTAKAGTLNPMELRVEQSVTRAKSAIEDARAAGAELYAPTTLQHAITQLRNATLWRDSGRLLDASSEADRAANTAIAAHTEAKPQYVIAQAKAAQHAAEVRLMAELSEDVTVQPVRTEDGVRVAVNGAFLPLDETLSEAGRAKLATIGQLAAKYPTFNLVLSASSTDARSATNALLIGQNRALNAGTYLQQMGISDTRVTTAGKVGEEGRTLWVHFVPDTQAAVVKTQLSAR